jgi:hypothetical protein
MENACGRAPTTQLREESCVRCPPSSLIHERQVPTARLDLADIFLEPARSSNVGLGVVLIQSTPEGELHDKSVWSSPAVEEGTC